MANLLSLNGWSSGLCQVSLAFYSKNLYCGLPCKGLPLLVPSLYPWPLIIKANCAFFFSTFLFLHMKVEKVGKTNILQYGPKLYWETVCWWKLPAPLGLNYIFIFWLLSWKLFFLFPFCEGILSSCNSSPPLIEFVGWFFCAKILLWD